MSNQKTVKAIPLKPAVKKLTFAEKEKRILKFIKKCQKEGNILWAAQAYQRLARLSYEEAEKAKTPEEKNKYLAKGFGYEYDSIETIKKEGDKEMEKGNYYIADELYVIVQTLANYAKNRAEKHEKEGWKEKFLALEMEATNKGSEIWDIKLASLNAF